MEDITKLNLHQTRDALIKKQFSCKELIASHVKEMESSRPLNLFITETIDHAIKSAEISDNNIKNKKLRNLEGLPFGIKDMFCTKDIKTTASSKMLSNFIPPYESTVTKNLWNDDG